VDRRAAVRCDAASRRDATRADGPSRVGARSSFDGRGHDRFEVVELVGRDALGNDDETVAVTR
jgi:hypothetical protein